MSSDSSSSSGSDNSDVIAYEVEAIRGKRIRWGGVRIIPFSRSISIEFSQTVQNSAKTILSRSVNKEKVCTDNGLDFIIFSIKRIISIWKKIHTIDRISRRLPTSQESSHSMHTLEEKSHSLIFGWIRSSIVSNGRITRKMRTHGSHWVIYHARCSWKIMKKNMPNPMTSSNGFRSLSKSWRKTQIRER